MVFNKFIKFIKRTKKSKKKKNSLIKKIKKAKPVSKKIGLKSKKTVIAIKEKLVGEAVHYFSKIKVAVLKLKTPLKVNEEIRIKGFTTDFKQIVSSMQIDHIPVKVAKKGQEVGIKVKGKVRGGDKVYKV